MSIGYLEPLIKNILKTHTHQLIYVGTLDRIRLKRFIPIEVHPYLRYRKALSVSVKEYQREYYFLKKCYVIRSGVLIGIKTPT